MEVTKTEVLEYSNSRAETWQVLVRGGRIGVRVNVMKWQTGPLAGKAEVRLIAGDGRTPFFEEFDRVVCDPKEIEAHVQRMTEKAKGVEVFTKAEADKFCRDLFKYLESPSDDERARFREAFSKHYWAILSRMTEHWRDNLMPHDYLAALVGFAVGFRVPERPKQ